MGLQASGNSSVLTISTGVPSPVQNFVALDRSVQVLGLQTPGYGTYFLLGSDGSVSIKIGSVFKSCWSLGQQQMIGGGLR